MQLVIFDLDDTLFDTTGQLAGSYEKLQAITPFDRTIPILEKLQEKKIPVVLITTGDDSIQRQKLEILKIAHLFGVVSVCKTGDEKLLLMKDAIKLAGVTDLKQVYVVGDRIDREIRFGNELGCTTVRVLQGKYRDLKAESGFENPAITLRSIGEFARFLE